LLAAGAAGEDYSTGCLKVLLSRAHSRSRYLAAKYSAAFVACLALLLCLFVSAAICGWVTRLGLHEPLRDGELAPGIVLGAMGYFVLEALYLAALGLFAATLTRSQGSGMILAVVGAYLIRAATFLPGGTFLPAIHFDVVRWKLLPGTHFEPGELASVLGAEPNLLHSILLLVAACAVFFALSQWLFARRDVR
jgi:ABC-type transport system involved in multi-copper enzyme maturation permease subunit